MVAQQDYIRVTVADITSLTADEKSTLKEIALRGNIHEVLITDTATSVEMTVPCMKKMTSGSTTLITIYVVAGASGITTVNLQ